MAHPSPVHPGEGSRVAQYRGAEAAGAGTGLVPPWAAPRDPGSGADRTAAQARCHQLCGFALSLMPLTLALVSCEAEKGLPAPSHFSGG